MTEIKKDQELVERVLKGDSVAGSTDLKKPKEPEEVVSERMVDSTRDLRNPPNTPLGIWEE